MLRRRYAKPGQAAVVYFVPSGLDLQRSWEKALEDFGAVIVDFVRIGLRMRRFLVRFIRPESFVHTRSRRASPSLHPGLSFRCTRGLVGVLITEENCSNYHGLNCSFGGELKRVAD
jgi:hypothetical protein